MANAHTWAELKGMTHGQLVEQHDRYSQIAGDHLITIRDELRYRERTRQTCAMLWMTGIITAATILNVILWALK